MSCHERHEHHEHHHGHHDEHRCRHGHDGGDDRERHSGCRCGGHGSGCGCGRGCACRRGGGDDGGTGHRSSEGEHLGFQRRFWSKADEIAELDAYLAELKAEAQAVEERLAELRR